MKTVKLGDISEIFAGGDVPKDNFSRDISSKYSIPIYANGEKNKGLQGYTDNARVLEPSITVSARGTIGYSEIRYEPFFPAVRLIVIIPKTDQIDLRYLYYAVGRIDFKNTGVSIPQLTVPMIKEYTIPIPSIEEQRRVVERLDATFEKIDRAIELTGKNLKNTKKLFTNLVENQLVGLSDKNDYKLGDVCNFVRGPFGGSLKKEYFKSDGYAVYEQRHAIYGKFSEVRYYIGTEKYNEMKRFELKPNDLIMSCSGTMGKIAIVPKDAKPGIINQALLKFSPKDEILDVEYLKHWIEGSEFQAMLGLNSGGAAIKNVASVKILKSLPIKLPTLSIQKNIVQEVKIFQDNASILKLSYTDKLRQLKLLKESLLAQAFSQSEVE